jgi:predicted permease
LDSILQDLRYAFRSLRRSPVFTLVAVITISVGIGATTTIFSVANAFLIRSPDGVRNAGDLVTVHALSEDGSSFHSFSYPGYTELRDANSGLTGLAAYRLIPASLTTEAEPDLLLGMVVSGNYFQLLGTRPALGRLIQPADDRGDAGADAVVVLSHRLWLRQFSGDSSVLGRTININRRPFTVIGVAEAGFQGHTVAMDVGGWVPMGVYPQFGEISRLNDPSSTWLETIGRAGEASMGQVTDRLSAAARTGAAARDQKSAGVEVRKFVPVPAQFLLPVGGFLGLMLIISGVILFIGSVNVGSLLLSRAAARSREIAVRLAIGAGRLRLVRQLLTESIVLFVLGGGAGVLFAFGATRALAGLKPPVGMPINFVFQPDLVVLAGALLVTLITGLVFGLVPALQSTRLDLAHAVRDEERSGKAARSRLRSVFVTVQVAGSVLLLVVGGLFVRALGRAGELDPGFNLSGLYAAESDLQILRYSEQEQFDFVNAVRRSLADRPGVEHVAVTDQLPLGMGSQSRSFEIPGRPLPNGEQYFTDFASVTPGYFLTMGIPLERGRDFAEQDRAREAPAVAIVNQAFARMVWGGDDPIGKTIDSQGPIEIVGLVRDSKYRTLNEEPLPMLYYPNGWGTSQEVTVIVRASGSSNSVAALLKQAIHDADPALPIRNNAPVTSIIGVSLLPNRIAAFVAGLFGAIGLVLATVGLYGLLAFTVTLRRREIGIRMALGAQAGDVRKLVLGQGLRLTLIGLAIGFALAFAATRLLASRLYGVSPLDPATFATISLLLGLTAALASVVPAVRATRTDPMVAIRHD